MRSKTALLTFVQTVLLTGSLLTAASANPRPLQSHYVPLQQNACRIPAENSLLSHYDSLGLLVVECPVVIAGQTASVGVLVVSSDARSWLDVIWGSAIWSSEEEVVYQRQNQFGYFPNIGATPAEILSDDTGAMRGLIFRVTAQDPSRQAVEPGQANISRLFVLGLRGPAVCWLGLAKDNAEARTLVESDAPCLRPLKSWPLR